MGVVWRRSILCSFLPQGTCFIKFILKGIQMRFFFFFCFRFYINLGYVFSFFAGIFPYSGRKKCWNFFSRMLQLNPFFHNFLLTFVTGSHQTRLHPTTLLRERVNSDSVGWPVSFMTSLVFSWTFPTPPHWQIDQLEVSAFLRRCKHPFMGFLLMHPMLGKAPSITFL